VAEGAVERIGSEGSKLWMRVDGGSGLVERPQRFAHRQAALRAVFEVVEEAGLGAPVAVGHRLAHGGPERSRAERMNPALLEALRELAGLTDQRLPGELRGIEAVFERYADLPQVVCYDTAFHWNLPEIARRLPLPRALYENGVRRFGAHGISYEHVVGRLGSALRGRAILAHLGQGSSMVATREGIPVDAVGGVASSGGGMTCTGTGDLDPGLFLQLLEKAENPAALAYLVCHQSGLLGVSGSSAEMRVILEKRSRDDQAALAFEMYCYQARKSVGALVAALGGLDTLVFTGGIGAWAPPVRERICAGLSHLGIRLDHHLNRADSDVISTDDSLPVVRVVTTDEELVIARHTQRILFPYGSE
jgi:acetate kinase